MPDVARKWVNRIADSVLTARFCKTLHDRQPLSSRDGRNVLILRCKQMPPSFRMAERLLRD